MRATQVIALLLAAGGTAGAQEASRTWDFQSDKVDEAPEGFSFGKTGQGRPGKWVVRLDPSGPAGDHVLAELLAGERLDRRIVDQGADAVEVGSGDRRRHRGLLHRAGRADLEFPRPLPRWMTRGTEASSKREDLDRKARKAAAAQAGS